MVQRGTSQVISRSDSGIAPQCLRNVAFSAQEFVIASPSVLGQEGTQMSSPRVASATVGAEYVSPAAPLRIADVGSQGPHHRD
eukprot:12194777-Alexandrium_andersonii.AAC.1